MARLGDHAAAWATQTIQTIPAISETTLSKISRSFQEV